MKVFVLRVKTGKELDVCTALRKKGFIAIAPCENRIIHKNGHWKRKEYILFGGYVFLEIEKITNSDYYKIRELPNVFNFLGIYAPEAITDAEARQIGILTANDIIEPSKVEFDKFGTPRIISGILGELKPISYDKHSRRAKVKFEFCGNSKTLAFSFIPQGASDNDT